MPADKPATPPPIITIFFAIFSLELQNTDNQESGSKKSVLSKYSNAKSAINGTVPANDC
jgi:hypothetical protein